MKTNLRTNTWRKVKKASVRFPHGLQSRKTAHDKNRTQELKIKSDSTESPPLAVCPQCRKTSRNLAHRQSMEMSLLIATATIICMPRPLMPGEQNRSLGSFGGAMLASALCWKSPKAECLVSCS